VQTFTTGMSPVTRWTGVGVLLLTVAVVVVLFARGVPAVYGVPAAGLMMVVLALTYAMSPLRYEVDAGQLVVRRQIGRLTVDLAGARVAADPLAFRGLVRVAGNGGFFALHGWFYSRRLGMVRVYARNSTHPIVLRVARGPRLVLSPDDPERFLAALSAEGAQVAPDTLTTAG
jgi:hypothetical protein